MGSQRSGHCDSQTHEPSSLVDTGLVPYQVGRLVSLVQYTVEIGPGQTWASHMRQRKQRPSAQPDLPWHRGLRVPGGRQ